MVNAVRRIAAAKELQQDSLHKDENNDADQKKESPWKPETVRGSSTETANMEVQDSNVIHSYIRKMVLGTRLEEQGWE